MTFSARRKRILLTNDDGLDSPALAALGRVLASLGDLLVVAPRDERSAAGCSITLHRAIEAEIREFEGARAAYAVDGTPADCSKLAIRTLFDESPPALCVSGLNPGPNVGVNVLYSGTVGAAIEAAACGVPAIALSKEIGGTLPPERAAELARPLVEELLSRGLPPWHILNVNVPDRRPEDVRGVRLTRHGVSGFDERHRREPGRGRIGRFMLEGEMRYRECDGLTDAEAIRDGWVSVTPMSIDLTSPGTREALALRQSQDERAGAPEGALALGPQKGPGWRWIERVPLGGA